MSSVLCVGLGGNPFTAYVAFTRVKGRAQLFIYRAFDAAPFQKGIGLGRDLLLRQLRGDRIDWKALLAKYCEERTCGACAERKPANAFTAGQWKRSDAERVCRECAKTYADAGTPWQCNVCKRWNAETNFQEQHWHRQCSFYRVCLTCETKRPCVRCGLAKPEADFAAAAWKARNAARRCCRTCAAKLRNHWACSHCEERKPRADFSARQATRAHAQDGTQQCNTCVSLALVCRVARRANQRVLQLRHRLKREREQSIVEDVRREIAAITERRQRRARRQHLARWGYRRRPQRQVTKGSRERQGARAPRTSCLPRAVPKRTRTTHSTTRARFVRLPSAALCVLAK